MNDKHVSASASASSIGFSGALTILFIALKLLGKISWPWIWVLSPLWIGAAIVIIILIVFLIVTTWLTK